MSAGWQSSARHMTRILTLLAILSLAMYLVPGSCGQAPPPQVQPGAFEGTWSVTGTRQVLDRGAGKRAVIFYISGSLVLAVPGGLSRGFRGEAIGYGNESGLQASCVWTDDQGDQIYSELAGPGLGTGSHVVGTITGGTGRYAGLTGRYEFDWQFVVADPEGVVQGWAVGLKGAASRTAPPAGRGSP